jgi:hypothetical protein
MSSYIDYYTLMQLIPTFADDFVSPEDSEIFNTLFESVEPLLDANSIKYCLMIKECIDGNDYRKFIMAKRQAEFYLNARRRLLVSFMKSKYLEIPANECLRQNAFGLQYYGEIINNIEELLTGLR